MWASRESSVGTAGTAQTARARAIIETIRTGINAVDGGRGEEFAELRADGPNGVLQRQVEGGVSMSSHQSDGRGSPCPRSGLNMDLNLSRVFSKEDAALFEDAMLEAVKDYRTPLANIFPRVQVWKLLLNIVRFIAGGELAQKSCVLASETM